MEHDVRLSLDSHGYVRPLHVHDVCQSYINALNDRNLTVFMETGGRTFVAEDIKAYIEQNLADPYALLWGVFDRDDRLVGTSRVHDISLQDSFCWMGIFLFHVGVMGKGLGSGVVRAVSGYALQELNLTSVRVGIISGNEASRGCFRKAGFQLLDSEPNYNGRMREIWERRLVHA